MVKIASTLVERRILIRAWTWPLLVPVCVYFGWHTSVFVVFLYSTYANWASDMGAYQAFMSRREEGGR